MNILFILIFVIAFCGLLFFKKSDNKLNIVVWLIITVRAEICLGSLLCGFIALIPIEITLITSCFVYGVIAIASWGYILIKKEHQRYYIDKMDAVCSIILVGIVICFALKTYGKNINFVFWNSDPAVHFENAMYYVRNHKLKGMWFASYYLGTMIQLLKPYIEQVSYYKVLIISDQMALAMQLLIFFVLIRDSMTNVWKRIVGMGMAILYICGYPLLCTYQGFFYWGICVLIIAFLIYILKIYRNNEIYRNVSVLYLMSGCFGVFMCYMLFAPITYIAVLLSLIAVAKNEGKIFTASNVILALKIFLIPCILGLYYCYFQWFVGSGMTATSVIAINGGIYSELYINFLIWIPFVIYWIINRIRDRKITELEIFTIAFIVFIVVLFVLVYNQKVSTYYYYKLYYPLWMLVFVILPNAIFELWNKERNMLLSLSAIIIFLVCMQFGKVEAKVVEKTILTPWDHSRQFFDLYMNNMSYASTSIGLYDQRFLDSCQFVIQNIEENSRVPIIADFNTYSYAYWYDAITGKRSVDYYAWCYSFDEVKSHIEAEECDYFIMIINSSIYQDNIDYWNQYPVVTNNGWGIIYKNSKLLEERK